MTIIEKIRAEIERRIKECEATYPKDKDGYWFPEQEEAYAIAEVEKWLKANFHHRNCWNADEFCISLRTYFGINNGKD